MSKIDSDSKTLSELLDKKKYAIDYYQREYGWGAKHITELLEDLEDKFFSSYDESHEHAEVENYPHYFLGSIVINHENDRDYLIDGQQRLTSLTLLLIYLYHLHGDHDEHGLGNMIFATKYGKKNFNLEVPERTACLEALYTGKDFDATDQPESVRNMVARYADIEQLFPDTLKDKKVLPYFTDWLIENVDLVVITAKSDDDAYAIFETMNDRGLSLSPTDMLKGYLLANVDDPSDKSRGNELWKKRILELIAVGREEEADFFKAWLRAKYADTIREGKKGASNKDFEKIGTEFHKWVKDEKGRIGLSKSADFRDFVEEGFARFSGHYVRIRKAAQRLTPGLEYVFYNAHNNFTLQYPLVLAPVKIEDDQDTVNRKVRLVAGYVDIFVARRVVNFRTLGYSSIVYTMFNLMKEIRDKDVHELAEILKDRVEGMKETFEGVNWFHLHQQNRRHVHHLLARMTRHIEKQSGLESSFESYVSREIEKPYEIEHIWADKYERHTDEFATEQEFAQYRNRFGNLILLPRGFNQSFGADSYEKKVEAYFGQNLLAQSLNERCYQNNPSFLSYVQRSNLPFKAHPTQFKKADLDARQNLYRQICEEIWSPARFDKELLS